MPSNNGNFRSVLGEAIAYFEKWGYENPAVLLTWITRLRIAAEKEAGPLAVRQKKVSDALASIFYRMIRKGRMIERANPHVSKITLRMISPSMKAELDRRIMASADLIKMNRTKSIEETLQRFSGWSTSIPPGGSGSIDKREIVSHISRPLQSRTFEERRLSIDQGHKLIANVNHIIGIQSGAIAVKWRHVHQAGYDGRPEHEARDGEFFVLRESWAREKGLVKKGPNPFYDDIEQVSVAPFCRCWAEFKVSLSQLPKEFLTQKGMKILEETRMN